MRSKVNKKGKLSKEVILLISIVVAIILVDQITKIWIRCSNEIDVISGVLTFKISENNKSAYGIGSNSKAMYFATNLVILGVIFKFISTQNEFVDKKLKVFLSFILAGGISNVIDKLIQGYVTEFIDFSQIVNLPVINIADLFILIGWVAIAAIFAAFTAKEWKNKDKN